MSGHHKTKAELADEADDDKAPPKHGTQVKADPGGPVPRFLNQNERAPGPEFTRFKIEARNYLPQPRRYVLAKKDDEKGARAFYTAKTTLDAQLDVLKANGVEKPEPPFLVVTKLSD